MVQCARFCEEDPRSPQWPLAQKGVSKVKHTGWLVALLVSICAVSLARERTSYVIKGSQESLRTDIEVKPGECVQITASGTIKMGLAVGWNGPEGADLNWIIRRTSKFPAGALIGAIVGDDGRSMFFLVGTDAGIEADRGGRLTFFINEKILADNKGEFHINIEREQLKSIRNRVSHFIDEL